MSCGGGGVEDVQIIIHISQVFISCTVQYNARYSSRTKFGRFLLSLGSLWAESLFVRSAKGRSCLHNSVYNNYIIWVLLNSSEVVLK
jgi:hypothetical protein